MSEIEQKPKEDSSAVAHRHAIEFANKVADPILQPALYYTTYWNVMAGYGWRPYIPGMPSHCM
jgi:hypothetical protein